jgi:hypothetical protein
LGIYGKEPVKYRRNMPKRWHQLWNMVRFCAADTPNIGHNAYADTLPGEALP